MKVLVSFPDKDDARIRVDLVENQGSYTLITTDARFYPTKTTEVSITLHQMTLLWMRVETSIHSPR